MSAAAIQGISKSQAIEILKHTKEGKKFDKTVWSRYVKSTDCLMAGYADEELLCIFGVIPPTLLSDEAYMWSYTFPSVSKFSFMFIRHSQLVIEKMLKHYPVIKGHAAVGDRRARRWLEWLGAKSVSYTHLTLPTICSV